MMRACHYNEKVRRRLYDSNALGSQSIGETLRNPALRATSLGLGFRVLGICRLPPQHLGHLPSHNKGPLDLRISQEDPKAHVTVWI